MRIDDLLAGSSEPAFSFEFFPPKTEEGERKLFAALDELRHLEPTYVSVTWGAGGSTRERTIDIVERIRSDFGLEAMAHFTCVGATVGDLRRSLDRMRDAGIDNVLALRGDPPAGQERFVATDGGLAHASDLARLVAAEYDFCLAGACYPEVHPESPDLASDLRHLQEKVDAGARVLITQLFFDNAAYFRFVDEVRAVGIDVPIIPGIMPITNFQQIKRFTSMCGARIPAELEERLSRVADDPDAVTDIGVAYATLQCADLLANGAPGIHFYTLNRSPATRAILSALVMHRPWDRSPGAPVLASGAS